LAADCAKSDVVTSRVAARACRTFMVASIEPYESGIGEHAIG
jgi:hypothetical protein